MDPVFRDEIGVAVQGGERGGVKPGVEVPEQGRRQQRAFLERFELQPHALASGVGLATRGRPMRVQIAEPVAEYFVFSHLAK